MELKRWLRAQWDRAAAVASLVIGALALLIGYFGVRDALYPGEQIPYVISGGLFGLFAVGLGAVLWLSADLRDEWRKLDEMDDKLTAVLDAVRRTSPTPPVSAPATEPAVPGAGTDTPSADDAEPPTPTATGSDDVTRIASRNGRRRPVRVG